MTGATSLELVRRAVANPAVFKAVSGLLRRRPPDDAAAAWLVAAFDAGEAPAWLVAHLLGQLRSPVGYGSVLRILMSGARRLSESSRLGLSNARSVAGISRSNRSQSQRKLVEQGTTCTT